MTGDIKYEVCGHCQGRSIGTGTPPYCPECNDTGLMTITEVYSGHPPEPASNVVKIDDGHPMIAGRVDLAAYRSGFEIVKGFPEGDQIVAMVNHNDLIYVATTRGLFKLIDGEAKELAITLVEVPVVCPDGS